MDFQLEPVAVHALFAVDMPALRDHTVDAREVLPRSFVAQVELLLPRASTQEAHRELHTLIGVWPQEPLPDWLWALYRDIRDSRGHLELAKWYAVSGHSARYISDRFKRAVGVTPKRLGRASFAF